MENMVDLFLTLYRLKDEDRRGWVLRGVRKPESVSDHSWGTAIICLIIGPKARVDVPRAVSMAIVHDLAEALTGDVPARIVGGGVVDNPTKKSDERRAFEGLADLVPFPSPGFEEARSLWEEYEHAQSPEALFVRDMNLIDMCLQALIYDFHGRAEAAQQGHRLAEFLATTKARLSTETGKELFREVSERYWAVDG